MDSSAALQSLPIRAGHTFTHVTGHDNSRLHLGDNHYKIGMSVVAGRLKVPSSDIELSDYHGTEQPEFTGHYSSTALRKVASYVPRPALHAQVKERLHETLEERGPSCKILVVCGLGGAGRVGVLLLRGLFGVLVLGAKIAALRDRAADAKQQRQPRHRQCPQNRVSELNQSLTHTVPEFDARPWQNLPSRCRVNGSPMRRRTVLNPMKHKMLFVQ